MIKYACILNNGLEEHWYINLLEMKQPQFRTKRNPLTEVLLFKSIIRFRKKTYSKAAGLFKCCINGRQVLYKSFLTLQEDETICFVTDNSYHKLGFRLRSLLRRNGKLLRGNGKMNRIQSEKPKGYIKGNRFRRTGSTKTCNISWLVQLPHQNTPTFAVLLC